MSVQDLTKVTTPVSTDMNKVRYPEIVYTQGYLDNPIQFTVDPRFFVSSSATLSQYLDGNLTRDFALFLQVDVNKDDPQNLPVLMYTSTLTRQVYNKVFPGSRVDFVQLGVTR